MLQSKNAAGRKNVHRSTRHTSVSVPAATPAHAHQQVHHRRSRTQCLATFAALDASKLLILPSAPEEYFPAADLHATCFGHSRAGNLALFERFDRIWALQINDDLARRGAGKCTLLVAYNPEAAPEYVWRKPAAAAAAAAQQHPITTSSSSTISGNSTNSSYRLPDSEQYAFPALGYWLSRMVERQVWVGLGKTFDALGIVGVAQVDSFGDIIPPRTLNASRDGAVGWVKREGIAYISNVAVAPADRRCGVAQRLMAEAESLAATWGCTRAALHCNPANEPAMQLYSRLRYRKGTLEAPWAPYLQGRGPDRCYLMLKRLKQQQQQQHSLSGSAVAAAGGGRYRAGCK